MLEGINHYKQVKKIKRIKSELGLKNLKWNQETSDGCSLFEEAVYAGYSEEDLMLLLTYAVEKGMNLNQRTSMYGDTYMHTLIECDDYHGSLAPFLYFGYLHGFKPTIENYCGKNVWDALKDPDTTKTISNSDKELCFKIKKLYELKEEKEKLEKIQKEIMFLQQEEHDLEKSINQNKTLVYEIKNALEKQK